MTFVQFYCDPASEFNRILDDALAAKLCPRARAPETKHAASPHRETYRPRLDLYESMDNNTVTASVELPGLTSEDVTIEVHQNRLIVSGEVPGEDAKGDKRNHIVRERRSGKFSRTLQLLLGTKPEDVKAKMEHGVLTITFPKTAPERQARRVVIE